MDELRRDIEVFKLGLSKGFRYYLVHDKCIVEPSVLVTKQGKAYAVRQQLLENTTFVSYTLIPRSILRIKETG